MREPLHETCADVSGLGQEYGTHWVCTSECPRPAGPHPERDARIEVYRNRERRRAARALDRYIDTIFPGHGSNPSEATAVANERFVEAVGDYVLSSLQQKSHYGATEHKHVWQAGMCVAPDPGDECAEARPPQHKSVDGGASPKGRPTA